MPNDQDKLVLTRTSWVVIAAGTVKLIGGVVFSLISVGLWIAPDVELGARVAFSVMGILFVALGICMGLGRYGTTIDRQKRLVTRWCGLVKPMWRTTVPYDGVERVELNCKFASGGRGKGGQLVYIVTLHGSGQSIPICRRDKETKGRADADRIAKFLQLPLHDETREKVVRHPDEIGVSIGQRLLSGQEAFALPPPPSALRTTIEPIADGLRLTLPRQGFSPVLLMIGGVCFTFVLLLAIGPGHLARSQAEGIRDDPHMSSLYEGMAATATLMSVCTGTLALGLGILFGWVVIRAAMTRVVVEATSQGVAVIGGAWRANIPASRVEEVRVEGRGASWVDPCFVFVRSAGKMARFGGYISRAEGEYLAELIKASLVPQTPVASAKE